MNSDLGMIGIFVSVVATLMLTHWYFCYIIEKKLSSKEKNDVVH